VRTIYIVRQGYRDNLYFRTRTAAEKYIEGLPRRAWKYATDVDRVSARYQRQLDQAESEHASNFGYLQMVKSDVRTRLRRDMEFMRQTIASGWPAFRDSWRLNNGSAVITEIPLYTRASEVPNEDA